MKDKQGREFYSGDEDLTHLELYIKYRASKSVTWSLLVAIEQLGTLVHVQLKDSAIKQLEKFIETNPAELPEIDQLLNELGYLKAETPKKNTKQNAIRDEILRGIWHLSYAIYFNELDSDKAHQALQHFWYHAGLVEGMGYSTSGPMTTVKLSRASKGGKTKSDKYTARIEAIASLLEEESPPAGWSSEAQAASMIAEVVVSRKISKNLNLSSSAMKCYDQLSEMINSNEKLRNIVNPGKTLKQ